jgi:hypothetical protein
MIIKMKLNGERREVTEGLGERLISINLATEVTGDELAAYWQATAEAIQAAAANTGHDFAARVAAIEAETRRNREEAEAQAKAQAEAETARLAQAEAERKARAANRASLRVWLPDPVATLVEQIKEKLGA